VDILHDMDCYPWPFDDNQFDKVLGNSVLEHIAHLIRCFAEIPRILKSGGLFKGGVLWYNYCGAFGDPIHKPFFTKKAFQYWTKDSRYSYSHKRGVLEIVRVEAAPSQSGEVIP